MKIKVDRASLAQKLNLAKKATASRAIIPDTANILLEGKDGRLLIKSCDTLIGISQELDAEISGNTIHAMSAPADLLQGMVNNLVGDDIQIEFAKDSIKLSAGKAKASVKALPDDNFPTLPSGHRKLCTLSSELMSVIGDLFVPFVATRELSEAMSGVFLCCENGQLEIISGSDWRGSYWKQPLESEDFRILIPAAERSVIKECSGQTEIWVSESGNHAILKTREGEFSTTLYDAEPYPRQRGKALADIAQVESPTIKVKSNVLVEAARMVDLVSNKINHEISIETGEESQVRLCAESGDKGNGTCLVDASVSGEPVSILVDARNLMSILNPLRGEIVLISAPEGYNLIMFRVEGNEYFYHGLAKLGKKQNAGS